ncbi:MAG: hypothetical protein ACRD3L_02655 [Terriglobales bacterium]
MLLDKLSRGVLRVLTPLGPRYVNPSLVQRLYLLWIFRNFHTLPLKVLRPRQQRKIDRMCLKHGFVSLPELNGLEETPVLGTLEQRPPMETNLPQRQPSQSVSQAVGTFAADIRQRS